MAFKSFAVAVETTDTEVLVCPATMEGAAVLAISNVTGSSSSYTLKLYRQQTDDTVTLADDVALAANASTKFPVPIAMEAGDKIVMTAPGNDIITVGGTFTFSAATPAAVGFTPMGPYNGGTTYNRNEYVSYTDGNSYVSRVDGNVGNQPDTSTAEWMVLAEKGAQGDGDLSSTNNLSDLASAATARENLGLEIGVDVQAYDATLFAGIPYLSAKSADYTAVIGDANSVIPHSGADNNARTFTIPANASVAFPVGTFLCFHNGVNTLTIAITSDTLMFMGSGATGSRTLAANGFAVALKVSSTIWLICGVGLS